MNEINKLDRTVALIAVLVAGVLGLAVYLTATTTHASHVKKLEVYQTCLRQGNPPAACSLAVQP